MLDVETDRALSGNFTTYWGNLIARTQGSFTGSANSGWDGNVGAYFDVAGVVIAKNNAIVTASRDVTGTISSSDWNVNVWSGRHCSGTLLAKLNVYVKSGGDVYGVISAGSSTHGGDVTIEAWGNVSATVFANERASIDANGDIGGNISSNNGSIQIKSSKSVTSSVQSINSWITVWAESNVLANVTAKESVALQTLKGV